MNPFNRTSMESKLTPKRHVLRGGIQLLIEPVWNRNVFIGAMKYRCYELLIEPVWNRNHAIHVGLHCNKLLIEPVWNRNFITRLDHSRITVF